MLQILGRDNSSNVQKVLWLCEELGVDYERHDYGGPFDNTTDDHYLSLNPNSRVPTLLDPDEKVGQAALSYVLWESNAILRYLCHKECIAKGDSTLYPIESQLRGLVEQWLDWQQTTVGPAITPVFWGLIRTAEADRNTAAINQGRTDTAAALTILDQVLGNKEFVVSNQFTIADIPLGIMTYRWYEMPIERPFLANVERWYQQLQRREPFQKIVMKELT